MTGAEKTTKPATLLHQLTAKLGLPLPDLVHQNLLPEKVAEQMAQNCAACQNPAKCQSYLAAHPDTVKDPPSFCVNARLLTFLCNVLPKSP